MKNDIKLSTLKHERAEIIDDDEFIQKLKNSKKLRKYVELELKRINELQKIIQNEKIENYNKSKFDYIKSRNIINEKGQVEDLNIIHGQVFTIDYKKNILNIIDIKIYEGHFQITNEYNYLLKDVGIVDNELKVILNSISKMKQKNSKKNDCDFLLYVLANRKKLVRQNKEDSQTENEIDNLFKLWNITEKYYSYKKYKVYLNLYEEIYIDYLKHKSAINLLQYENIRKQMKEIKKEILKGE